MPHRAAPIYRITALMDPITALNHTDYSNALSGRTNGPDYRTNQLSYRTKERLFASLTLKFRKHRSHFRCRLRIHQAVS